MNRPRSSVPTRSGDARPGKTTEPTAYDTRAGNANRPHRLSLFTMSNSSIHLHRRVDCSRGSLSHGRELVRPCGTTPSFVTHAIESMFMWRIVSVTLVGLACTTGVLALMVLPDMAWMIPRAIRSHRPTELALACVILYAAARRVAAIENEGRKSAAWARAGLRWVDRFSSWALQIGLKGLLGLLCAGLLLAWVPHYLTWPWCRDAETFAVLAQSWDHGILPYRDIRAYNFPGATYLAWVLGKVFGWGHTAPLYAFDAACVVLLGPVMVAWSRRRLGDAVPGVIGYFALVVSYLGLTYELVAQRDWYTAFLLCLGLLLMQAWPGRWARFASALAAALALTIRPHAVLFFPALLWEVAFGVDASAFSTRTRLRAVAVWCSWFGLFVVLAFAPLVLAGIADDLVRGLRVAAYGGPYSKTTPANMIRSFAEQFESWRTDVPLAATLILASRRRSGLSGIARAWSVAWLGALFYEPIHPVHHLYLHLPLMVVSSITWTFAASWLLASRRISPPLCVLAFVFMIYQLMPARPWMCNPAASLEAAAHVVSRRDPDQVTARLFPTVSVGGTGAGVFIARSSYISGTRPGQPRSLPTSSMATRTRRSTVRPAASLLSWPSQESAG